MRFNRKNEKPDNLSVLSTIRVIAVVDADDEPNERLAVDVADVAAAMVVVAVGDITGVLTKGTLYVDVESKDAIGFGFLMNDRNR
jgi:hypothetical protein